MKARSQSSGRPSHCPNDGEVLADCGWARSTQLAASGEDSRGIVSFDRECLAIVVERRITAQDVIDQLFNLLVLRGIPEHIRSDNGPEFTARKVRGWLNHLGVKTLFIEPGSPWENGYIESFNGKLRDELL